MKSGNKKILIIAIIIIVLLAIIGTIVGFIVMYSDIFKSEKDMFAKYFMQNIEVIKNLKSTNIYDSLDEKTYESNIGIDIKYSEGGEISNPINELSAKMDVKKDYLNKYFYSDMQILYKDEEYLEFELIRQNDISGIRFSDVVKQFVTVRNDENKENIANNIGIEESKLENYIEILNGTKSIAEKIITTDEINSIKDNYISIIRENLNNAKYENLKKVMITFNNSTIKVNAYSMFFSANQVGDMVMQILENMKTDEILMKKAEMFGYENFSEKIESIIKKLSDYEKFKDIKITVYQQNDITIRTEIEFGTDKITIESDQNKINITRNIFNNEEEQSQSIEIVKENIENTEKYKIIVNILDGDDIKTITLANTINNNENVITIDTVLKYISGIKETTVTAKNTINILEKLNEKLEMDNSNNIILNDLDEETMKSRIDILKAIVPEKIKTRINLLKQALQIADITEPEEEKPEEYEMTQVEINRFNAKFEFYTGESVSAQNVMSLLEVVKSNLNSLEITNIEPEDIRPEEIRVNIKLNIEKDKENTDLINQVIEKIKESKKYKVTISYKQDNGLIENINIIELEN